MGKVEEYDDLCKELREIIGCADNIDLFKTKVNKRTDLTLSARPLCFDVILGNDLIYSCNHLGNAHIIYDVIRADLKGELWHGNTCTSGF